MAVRVDPRERPLLQRFAAAGLRAGDTIHREHYSGMAPSLHALTQCGVVEVIVECDRTFRYRYVLTELGERLLPQPSLFEE
jgi:hypothetical protein